MPMYNIKECDFCSTKDIDGQRIYICDMCQSFSCANHKMKVLSDDVCLCEECNTNLNTNTSNNSSMSDVKFRYTYSVTDTDGKINKVSEIWSLKDMEDFNIANCYGQKMKSESGTLYVQQHVVKKEIFVSAINKWLILWELLENV